MSAEQEMIELLAGLKQTATDLAEHRQTHVVWRDWLLQNPENAKVNPHAGSAEFHGAVILDYDRHLGNIEKAITALSAQSAGGEAVAWVNGLELQDFINGNIAFVVAAKESGVRDTPIYLHPAHQPGEVAVTEAKAVHDEYWRQVGQGKAIGVRAMLAALTAALTTGGRARKEPS